MIRSTKRWITILVAVSSGGLLLSSAFAQPQPQPQPIQVPVDRPRVQPMPPGQPGQQFQVPNGPRPGGIQMPGGRPGGLQMPPNGRPGTMPGGRPGTMPGGRPGAAPIGPNGRPLPGGRPATRPRPHAVEAPEPERPDEENCPGHGPDDPPHHVNWWRGNLMVNNERAREGGLLNTLLFRYENEENPCDPKNDPPPFSATVVNFLVLIGVLYKYGRKPLADALVKRKQSIMAEIDQATKLKEEAEARLAEYEEKLENIHETLEEVRAEYATQGEAERRRIVEEAEERRVRMRKDAEFRIEQELKSARSELLREAVEKAVSGAEKSIRAKIQSADHDKLAEDYLKSIGAAVAGAAKPRTLAGGAS